MTTADIPAWKSPTNRPVAPFVFLTETTGVITEIFRDFADWITLPAEPAGPVSPLPRLLKESRDVTGWGQRELASVLGSTHPTVGRLETGGRVTARSRDLAARVAELHAVLVRLARVAGGPDALNLALRRTVRDDTALDLLRAGEWAKAYTAGLDAIRGERPAMLGASRAPLKAATRELRP